MALYNEILVGRIQQLYTRLLGMVGGSPVPQLAPELQAGLDLTSVRNELALLQGIRWFRMCGTAAAGGAGVFSRFGARNPTGSGNLIVITRIQVLQTVLATIQLHRVTTVTPTAPGTLLAYTDSRTPNISPPLEWSVGSSAVALLAGVYFRMAPAINTVLDIETNIVLAPGGALELSENVGNNGLWCSMEAYVREATPGELTAS